MLALFFFTGERFIFTAVPVPLFLTEPEDNRAPSLVSGAAAAAFAALVASRTSRAAAWVRG